MNENKSRASIKSDKQQNSSVKPIAKRMSVPVTTISTKIRRPPKAVQKIAIGNAKERLNALMIDGIVVLIISYSLLGFPSLLNFIQMGAKKITLYSFIVIALYETIFLKYKGATIGKMLFKVKVIQYQNPNKPLSLKNCLIRSFSKSFFSTIASYLPYAFAFFNTERRQLADFLANTQVISTNSNRPSMLPKLPILGIICLLFAIYSFRGTITNLTKKVENPIKGVSTRTFIK